MGEQELHTDGDDARSAPETSTPAIPEPSAQSGSSTSNDAPSLADLLSPASICLNATAQDWRDAVRTSGTLLAASGCTTEAYTDQMIAAVERFGPYIVIAPGLALAHAQASDEVHRTGMSWLTLSDPVSFGHPDNDPVFLVIGLAATDHEAHMTALQQLAMLLGEPSARAALDAATTPDALLDTITRLVGKKDS
ncbi:hypothetical protein KEM60_03285 [Austwickia sp. TVS 96-490-7B]|uniref:PTS sugar transporter subunit IIA n=1 Tax=Austwickia sp. TVS 96-490-7B TaxID=2830843 RepID=UPI001C5845D8|nr:PTS sugar transporter subunit IIA [Austwickia sp. TVS 96-490-7B]MBW3087055.1 hypothetical protein [Austwickia sp. TVS 96-490-7B]